MSIFSNPAHPRPPSNPRLRMEAVIFGAGLVAAIVVGVIASSMLNY
jgi:hypothetical protein